MWNFYNPVEVKFGPGCLAALPTCVGDRKAILITFPEAAELGVIDKVQALLGDRLIAIEDQVQPNPDISWLEPMYLRCIQDYAEAECIIALGGGSVIDCAKALLTVTPSGTFSELIHALKTGAPVPCVEKKELIALPTTAGTGSEVTPWATLWDEQGGNKYSLHLPWTWARHALVDPELNLSLPAGATLAGGLDSLSHALESLWNVHRTSISATYARQAIRQILRTLPALMKNLNSPSLRESMSLAALKAGWAFSQTKTALAHSLSYEFTLKQNLPHGIACSFSLPRVMELALGIDDELDSEIASAFSVVNPHEAVGILYQFIESLGVSTHPQYYGISEKDWDQLVIKALEGPRGQNFIGRKC